MGFLQGFYKPTAGFEPGTPSYERKTNERRASTQGRARARSRWKLRGFAPLSVDARARLAPS